MEEESFTSEELSELLRGLHGLFGDPGELLVEGSIEDELLEFDELHDAYHYVKPFVPSIILSPFSSPLRFSPSKRVSDVKDQSPNDGWGATMQRIPRTSSPLKACHLPVVDYSPVTEDPDEGIPFVANETFHVPNGNGHEAESPAISSPDVNATFSVTSGSDSGDHAPEGNLLNDTIVLNGHSGSERGMDTFVQPHRLGSQESISSGVSLESSDSIPNDKNLTLGRSMPDLAIKSRLIQMQGNRTRGGLGQIRESALPQRGRLAAAVGRLPAPRMSALPFAAGQRTAPAYRSDTKLNEVPRLARPSLAMNGRLPRPQSGIARGGLPQPKTMTRPAMPVEPEPQHFQPPPQRPAPARGLVAPNDKYATFRKPSSAFSQNGAVPSLNTTVNISNAESALPTRGSLMPRPGAPRPSKLPGPGARFAKPPLQSSIDVNGTFRVDATRKQRPPLHIPRWDEDCY